MRLIAVIDQPCVLCEETLETWTIYRDDETGREQHRITPASHVCEPLRDLIAERFRTAPEK